MPAYAYTARDRSGKSLTGQMDASSQDGALAALQGKGYLVTSMSLQVKAGVPGAARRRKLHAKVRLDDQILFCRQLGTMLNAGVPLLRGLEVMRNQLESKRLMVALADVVRDVEAGQTFRDSLAKHPKVFTAFWINLVETGEASGHLGDSLNQMAQFLERSKMLQEKLMTALLYPAFLCVIALGAVGFFSIVVIPMFDNLFKQFNAELPPITKAVLVFGVFMKKYFLLVIAVGVGVVWLSRQYAKTPQGRWVVDGYSLRIPIVGTLLYDAQIVRFAAGLGTLLESGVPVLFALEILERSADNLHFGQAFGLVKNDVREGKPMAVPLETSGLFPPMVVQMVQVGEEIGELSAMLGRVAAYYEEKIRTLADRMAVLFEPIALVFVGALVGFLVIALFLPLFDIASKVR